MAEEALVPNIGDILLNQDMTANPQFFLWMSTLTNRVAELESGGGGGGPSAPVTGTGSPEGVVTAEPGIHYVDITPDTSIVTNGDFSDGINGWSQFNAVISAVNNRMRVDDSANQGGWSSGWQEISVDNGQTYTLEWEQFFVNASAATVAVSTQQPNNGGSGRIATLQNDTTQGSRTLNFTATSTTLYIWFVVGGTGTVDFDNIAIPGGTVVEQRVYLKATGTGNTGWVAT